VSPETLVKEAINKHVSTSLFGEIYDPLRGIRGNNYQKNGFKASPLQPGGLYRIYIEKNPAFDFDIEKANILSVR
jgi:hypothetical protein